MQTADAKTSATAMLKPRSNTTIAVGDSFQPGRPQRCGVFGTHEYLILLRVTARLRLQLRYSARTAFLMAGRSPTSSMRCGSAKRGRSVRSNAST